MTSQFRIGPLMVLCFFVSAGLFGCSNSESVLTEQHNYTGPALSEDNVLYMMGMKYLNDDGLEGDIPKAIQLLTKAAERNHIEAQLQLVNLYSEGRFIEQNFSEAYFWSDILVWQGFKPAIRFRVTCPPKMSPV